METCCSCTEMTNSDWVTDWQPPSQISRGSPLHGRARRPCTGDRGGGCAPQGGEVGGEASLQASWAVSWSHHGPGEIDMHVCFKGVWNCPNPVYKNRVGLGGIWPVLTFLSLQRRSHHHMVSLAWLHITAIIRVSARCNFTVKYINLSFFLLTLKGRKLVLWQRIHESLPDYVQDRILK